MRIVWVVLSLGFTIAIGLLGRAFLYPEILGVTEGAPSAESVFIEMIQKVFIEKIPIPLIAGLFICGILAAVMSTADSQLLVCSSSVSKDIYQNILNPEASDKKVLNVARMTTFGVAVVAFFHRMGIRTVLSWTWYLMHGQDLEQHLARLSL